MDRQSSTDKDSYTLPQLSELILVRYRTLHSWVERGLLRPSVRKSSGTGIPNLFSRRDAVAACVLADLRSAGVNFDLLQQAATRLRQNEDALAREAYMLVNGDVQVVFGPAAAAAALRRGGLTLAYNTSDAVERVERVLRP